MVYYQSYASMREEETVAREKTCFACTACGYETARWVGRCPGCGAWNTMEESVAAAPAKTAAAAKPLRQRPGSGGLPAVLPDHRKQSVCHGLSPLCPSLCRASPGGDKKAGRFERSASIGMIYFRYRSTARATMPPSRPLTRNSATPWMPTSSTTNIRGLDAPLAATRPCT